MTRIKYLFDKFKETPLYPIVSFICLILSVITILIIIFSINYAIIAGTTTKGKLSNEEKTVGLIMVEIVGFIISIIVIFALYECIIAIKYTVKYMIHANNGYTELYD